MSDTPTHNLHQRIIAIAAEVAGVEKDRRNKEQGFDYSSHDAVVEAVRGAMIRHKVVFNLGMESVEHERFDVQGRNGSRTVYEVTAWFRWRMTNADNPADTIDDKVWMHALSSDDKGPGKLVSYAKKYALLACVGFLLPTGIDLDEESLTPPPANDPAPKRAAKKPSPQQTGTDAEPVVPTLAQARARYGEVMKMAGLTAEQMGEAFKAAVPEDKRQDARAIEQFLYQMERRYSAWLEVMASIEKWTISGTLFDATVAKIVGGEDTVSTHNWFLWPHETLDKLIKQLDADFDLPFDKFDNKGE